MREKKVGAIEDQSSLGLSCRIDGSKESDQAYSYTLKNVCPSKDSQGYIYCPSMISFSSDPFHGRIG